MRGVDHLRHQPDAPHLRHLPPGQRACGDAVERQIAVGAGDVDLRALIRQEMRRIDVEPGLRFQRAGAKPEHRAEHEKDAEGEIEIGRPVGPVEPAASARRGQHREHAAPLSHVSHSSA
jgi:hypothetical protein